MNDTERAAALVKASEKLSRALRPLRFGVHHVYDPLTYAKKPHVMYLQTYGQTKKQVLFFGMNPGPFGMTQTGVPFGEIEHVRHWLGIEAPVSRPKHEHPKRPITGFATTRSEVSGARFWGLWQQVFHTPARFFAWAFVSNYCPLVFMEESGRNITPDKLAPQERAALYAPCDAHMRTVLATLEPAWVVGVGKFAEGRARSLLEGVKNPPRLATIPHPSPASPAANRDWGGQVLAALRTAGVPLPTEGSDCSVG